MNHTLSIKNMVCDRCKSTVVRELEAAGYIIESIELGQVIIKNKAPKDDEIIKSILSKHGFELIKDEEKLLIENIKIALISKIESQNNTKLSTFLTTRFNKPYATLSKLFSKTEGITIEKYEINLKIEKVKELIQLGQLNFSQIAYSLDYNNSSHLSRQFKTITGLSMTAFKDLHKWNRKSIDQIV